MIAPTQTSGALYGDEIIYCGWYRVQCVTCSRYLDAPLGIIKYRDREFYGLTIGE